MQPSLSGIHHVTALCGDPQTNLDFYAGFLGLRLVKRTVNFDDPGTYHLYYGDGPGTPGSILTFFPWPGAPRGKGGVGQVAAITLAIPDRAITYWQERVQRHGVALTGPTERFGAAVYGFVDPDGLPLEFAVVDSPNPRFHPWAESGIPVEQAIRGVHSATIPALQFAATAQLLTAELGWTVVGQEGNRTRYTHGDGTFLDVLDAPLERRAMSGIGTVHHIAFRTADDGEQLDWLQRLTAAGHSVSPVMDRDYFHSIYFREPGHVLFEIATDPPGFTADEPLATLGERLQLPAWLAPQRDRIEIKLPPVHLPHRMQ